MDSHCQICSLPILGLFFFFTLHLIIRHCLRLFRNLTEANIYAITCRVVSAIQAIIASVFGLIIAYSCRKNIMTDVHWLTNAYVCFGISYFPYDVWAMYSYNIRLKEHIYLKKTTLQRIKSFLLHNKLMLIHHIILPAIIFPIILFLRDNRGDFFFGVFYMIEIVVPFISAREILIQLKMKNTKLYFVTSIVMIIAFFMCRIAVFPYLYSAYAGFANQPMFRVPFIIPIKCNIGCVLILIPQIYWFALMVRGLYRLLIKNQVASTKDEGKIC